MLGRRRPIRLAGALLVGLWACGSDDAGAGGTEGSGSGTSGEPPPRPTFIEPASDRLSLVATRTDDVTLVVDEVAPGLTDLVIDGQGLGPLPSGDPIGTLEADRLRLHVRGSMIVGRHRMQLRTATAGGIAESEEIEIDIGAGSVGAPTATVSETAALPGDHVLAMGTGDAAVLVVLERHADGPRVHLLPWVDDHWAVDDRRTLPVPGLAPALLPTLPVAAQRQAPDAEDGGGLRVAWRGGAAGDHIAVVDTTWDAVDLEQAPTATLGVDAVIARLAPDRPPQWAQLGRPWLMGDRLVAELWAPLDVESPRPGDHALLHAALHDGEIDPPQRVSLRADVVDVDRLGPAIDHVAAALDRPAPVSIRLDRRQPLVLELDPATGLLQSRATVVDGRDRSFTAVDRPLATILGAFGSRTVAGLQTGPAGELPVVLLDDLGSGGTEPRDLVGDGSLPDLDTVRGDLAPGVLGGLSVFLLPFGDDAPVQAIYAAGSTVRRTALEDLHCDAVALPGHAGDGETLPLACVRDGMLWLGTLHATPAP